MDDLISEFLVETNESLDDLDQKIVQLEQNPDNPDVIRDIFRVMHTIKGTCGFLGLSRLESIAHSVENIMDKLREDEFKMTAGITSLVLEAIDLTKDIIQYLEENGSEGDDDDSALIGRINACADSGGKVEGETSPETPAPATPSTPSSALDNSSIKTPDLDGEIDFEPVMAPDAIATPSSAIDNNSIKTPDLDGEIDFEPVMAPDAIAKPPEAPTPNKTPAVPPTPSATEKKEAIDKGLKEINKGGTNKKPTSGQSIRVGIDVLEELMQMVGELVLTRNQLLQMVRTNSADKSNSDSDSASQFNAPLQRLNHITSGLQEGVMATRMQPIGNAWAKFPRLVRDLGMELNKKIELKMIGAETDLDRQMLEAIKDPLTHMVRNSADHGLETGADRIAAGKSETGCITLSAYHEGGHIIIRIADNGRGLNAEKIKTKILENNLATAEELNNMSEKQIQQFIFKAGFSTAETVSAVSGRGVGMDVVVSNIERIGGTIDLNSTAGKGSEFLIKLPLTLAIMPVLIIKSADETFAIPQIRVSEIVRAASRNSSKNNKDSIDQRIETINGCPVLRLRGRLLPLISLSKTLQIQKTTINANNDNDGNNSGVDSPTGGDEPSINDEDSIEEHISNELSKKADEMTKPTTKIEEFIVVCEVGNQKCGILVDKVFHTEEIVVKPVASVMSHLEVYAGCTILGDGSVIMIIDPNGVLKSSSFAHLRETDLAEEECVNDHENRITSFLTFKAWDKAPKAIPLDLVSRLEEIDMSTVEWSGNHRVVQYRDSLMRLVTLNPTGEIPEEGIHEIVVFTDEDRVLGIVVEEIIDIASHEMDMKALIGEDGILGSLIIDGITMDMLDISHFFSTAFGNWMTNNKQPDIIGNNGEVQKAKRKHILLVDDSPFFRKFMKPVLVVSNYDVTTAECAKDALSLLEKGEHKFDLIITDIDMPEMNGVEFLKTCLADERFSKIPFIGLSSHEENELGEGSTKELGFKGYVMKSERNKLVQVISDVLGLDKVAA